MRVLFYVWLLLGHLVLAQSIGLDEPPVVSKPVKKHVSSKLSFVEFRDAKLENVLKLIKTQGRIRNSQKKNLQADLSLRLENVSWAGLLKIILRQVNP